MRRWAAPDPPASDSRTTCHRLTPTISMGDVRLGGELAIRDLLCALREEIASILQRKPLDLTLEEAREYEEGINDVLVSARSLVNSFHITIRVPPEILTMACSYLTTEEDIFSASQVCHHWRGILVSSSSLWTRFPCHRLSRTIVSLERCRSMPIQLEFSQYSSSATLENILLRGPKIASLTIHEFLNHMPLLDQLFVSSGPSVEQLHINCAGRSGWRPNEQTAHNIWQDLPSLRQLFVSQYSIPIDQLAAPNLVHLVLERPGYHRDITIQSILNMLRGCPQLETLFISDSNVNRHPTHNPSPVSLQHLRSIELGVEEVRSGLVTHLRFPSNIAAGFRLLSTTDICNDVPLTVVASIQHVLGRIDIHCITLAVPPYIGRVLHFLVRFEGRQASLEITACVEIYEESGDVFFGPRGALFSHSPRIENVRELHIIGCHFVDGQALDHINSSMPNLVSISFFNCEYPWMFVMPPKTSSWLPFPRLERIMVLGTVSGLRGMVEARRDCGVPLKSLVIGQANGDFQYDQLEDHAALEEFVDELRIECPTEILEWGGGNEILNHWSTIEIPGLYDLAEAKELFRFCRFNVYGCSKGM